MPLKPLTSAETFWMKIGLPATLLPILCIIALELWGRHLHGGYDDRIVVTGQSLVFVAVVFGIYQFGAIKRVRIDKQFLYVSNYVKEVSIPFGLIEDVTESLWGRHIITVQFKAETAFGKSIKFIPWQRPRYTGESRLAIVDELKQLAGLEK